MFGKICRSVEHFLHLCKNKRSGKAPSGGSAPSAANPRQLSLLPLNEAKPTLFIYLVGSRTVGGDPTALFMPAVTHFVAPRLSLVSG